MPELLAPTTLVQPSFLAAMAEFTAEGRGGAGDDSMVGRELRTWRATWHRPEVFEEYTAALRADAREETPRPDGFVPGTTLWYADGAHYLGRIALRHRLTPHLRDVGGHVGYDVRPSARRRGHATAMLRGVLPYAVELGLDRVLVTCDHDNTGSRKVIEACGGVFEDRRGAKLRYWVPTGRA